MSASTASRAVIGSTAPNDNRDPEGEALVEWLRTSEGMKCLEPSILYAPNYMQFLENRLRIAFSAGAKWAMPKR